MNYPVFTRFPDILKPVRSFNATKRQQGLFFKELRACSTARGNALITDWAIRQCCAAAYCLHFPPLSSLVLFCPPTSPRKSKLCEDITPIRATAALVCAAGWKINKQSRELLKDKMSMLLHLYVDAFLCKGKTRAEATRRLLSHDAELIRARASGKVTLPSQSTSLDPHTLQH